MSEVLPTKLPTLAEILTSTKRIRGPYSTTIFYQVHNLMKILEAAEGLDMFDVVAHEFQKIEGIESNTILENGAGDKYVRVKDLLGGS